MENAFSIDLEDWFCVQNFSHVFPREQWDGLESRVERNTLRLLEILTRHNVQGTFFVLGWIAERYPDLVREVERRGHEIATHGYSHKLLTFMTPEEFRADLERSLDVLSNCTSTAVTGFRAPSFSVTRKTWWAVDILKQCGIAYDSSIFPVGFHPDYGIGDAPLVIHELGNGLTELPMSCADVMGRRIPCSGGGYFRLVPYFVTKSLMKKCNAANRPVIFYLHPWEVDPGQPRVSLPAVKAFRHYNNLDKTEERLEQLLADFPFTTMKRLLASRSAAYPG